MRTSQIRQTTNTTNKTNEPRIFDLSDKRIQKLTQELFSSYNNEEILDLSKNNIRFLPPWLKQFPIKKLIISHNEGWLALSFKDWMKNTPNLIVEAFGIGLLNLPEGIKPEQVKCEIDFTSNAYWDKFTQLEDSFSKDEV